MLMELPKEDSSLNISIPGGNGAVNAGTMALPHSHARNGVQVGRGMGRAWPWRLEMESPGGGVGLRAERLLFGPT